MTIEGFFTESDRSIVSRAARLAEGLVVRYFNLSSDEWVKNPYSLLTWKEASNCLRDDNVLAQTVRFRVQKKGQAPTGGE